MHVWAVRNESFDGIELTISETRGPQGIEFAPGAVMW